MTGFSQLPAFPPGVYLNIEQLKSQTPAYQADFQIIRRTSGDIGFNGGNDYEIVSGIDSLEKKFIKKQMYAYVKNDSLYLNCIHHKLSTWYALCTNHGNYLLFKGSMSNEKSNEEVSPYSAMFGAIGGGIAASNAAKKRFLYAFSLRSGNARLLTKEYLLARLQDNKELLEQYQGEKEQASEEVLIKYINKLNETTSVYSAPSPPQPK